VIEITQQKTVFLAILGSLAVLRQENGVGNVSASRASENGCVACCGVGRDGFFGSSAAVEEAKVTGWR